MKNINLDNNDFLVSELELTQQKDIEGGVIGVDDVIYGVAIYVACQVIDGVARYVNGERIR